MLSFFLAFAILFADVAPVAYAIDGAVSGDEGIIITEDGQVTGLPEGVVIEDGATVIINGEDITDSEETADLADVAITAADVKYVATGKDKFKSAPKLTDTNGKALKAGTDYDKNLVYRYEEDTELENGIVRRATEVVNSADIVPAGTIIRVTAYGMGNYDDEASTTYRVTAGSISSASITVENQNYTGYEVEPEKNQITVKVSGKELSSDQYEIVEYSNNVKIGTAKITIAGLGNYGGTKTGTFRIQAKSATTTIKFMPNGGSGSLASQKIGDKDITLTDNTRITRKGYVFTGWNTEADGTGVQYDNKGTFSVDDRGDALFVRLYAQWEVIEYTINYENVDDADFVNEPKRSYTVDDATYKLETPVRDGYKFEGWYTNSNLKSGKTTQISKGTTKDYTFYAKWKAL